MRRFILLLVLVALLTSAAVASAQQYYVVRPGDTLFRIALRFNTSVAAISAANNIYNPNFIFAGQTLLIPSGYYPPPHNPPPHYPPPGETFYTVQRGDRLSDIARRFGTTVQALAAANGIANINRIFPGQVLRIVYAQQPRVAEYYVQYGDTLANIAQRFGANLQDIASYNNLAYPYWVYPGQLLYIPYY